MNKYILEHTTRQEDALKWIEVQTHIRTNYAQMLSGPVQGRLLKMLAELSGAQRVLEIGSFTGYSAAWMALGLPEGGKIDALEINDELEDLMLEGWRKAGVEEKINLIIGDARQTLSGLSGDYDLVFIDANKREYIDYYELCLPLTKKGGLIIADDVLWDGKVYANPVPSDPQTAALLKFNDMVATDPRVEAVMLPLRDGLTLIRKK